MEEGLEKTRVIVAIETRIYREGIAQLLEKYEDTELLAMVSEKEQILSACAEQQPHIVLLDATIPNALIVAREIKQQFSNVKLIVLAMSACRKEMTRFAGEGALEFVTREDSLEDLRRCINAAMTDGFWCSNRVAELLLSQEFQPESSQSKMSAFTSSPSQFKVDTLNSDSAKVVVSLTRQQVNVLQFIESGLSNKEIARNLNIETATVKNHVHHILRKLQVTTRGEAAATYRRMAEAYSVA